VIQAVKRRCQINALSPFQRSLKTLRLNQCFDLAAPIDESIGFETSINWGFQLVEDHVVIQH